MKDPIMSESTKEKDKTKHDLGLLEEDDDFEEFPAESWTVGREEDNTGLNPWEDNWDDDVAEEDFAIQLKSEIEKMKQKKT